jgi:hypothetical protein
MGRGRVLHGVAVLANGGRLRGTIVEESPAAGVRIKLVDGRVRQIPTRDAKSLQYGRQPAHAITKSTSVPVSSGTFSGTMSNAPELAAAGVLQVLGLAGSIVGIAVKQTKLVRDDHSLRVDVAPIFVAGGAGLGVVGGL